MEAPRSLCRRPAGYGNHAGNIIKSGDQGRAPAAHFSTAPSGVIALGVLRLLLALCVFCGHSRPLGGLPWLEARLAVELFFVISGFYMQLVLSTRYTKEKLGEAWKTQFYKARYFRLLPIYLGGSLLALATALSRPNFAPVKTWIYVYTLPNEFGNLLFKAFLCLTNVTMAFQDVTMFLSAHDRQIQWSANFLDSDVALWGGLVIPQAWSLGVELSFYLVAPYLFRLRSRWLVLATLLCLTIKMIVVRSLHLGDPWLYRFFPFELGYFLLGALAFRHRNLLEHLVPKSVEKYFVYLLVVGFTAFSLPLRPAALAYPVALTLLLPFLFRVTSGLRTDRLIGELSYPFYIFHFLALKQVGILAQHGIGIPAGSIAWMGLGLTLIFSAIALVLELRFVEPWRARFTQHQIK